MIIDHGMILEYFRCVFMDWALNGDFLLDLR